MEREETDTLVLYASVFSAALLVICAVINIETISGRIIPSIVLVAVVDVIVAVFLKQAIYVRICLLIRAVRRGEQVGQIPVS